MRPMEKIQRLWRCAECGYTDRGMARSYQHALFHWDAEEIFTRLTGSDPEEVFPILMEDIDVEEP